MKKILLAVMLLTLLILLSTSTTATACKTSKDCEKIVNLKEPGLCVGQVKIYQMSLNNENTVFPLETWSNALPLLGKRYTDKIQVAYRLNYKCINDQCIFTDKDSGKKNCKYGCLAEPVEYNGKTWQNFCICKPGYDPNKPIHCGKGENNRFAYETFIDWTCETPEKLAYICSIGWRCVEHTSEVTCEEIPGEGPFNYPEGTTYGLTASNQVAYTLVIPKNQNQTITVAAIQNGKVIASKPISNLTAEQYITQHGPLYQSQALAFAQSTGLTTTVASTQNTTTTPNNASITTASYNKSYTPKTINTLARKPSWSNYTNTTRTNTYKPGWTTNYSNYYTRDYSYTPKTSYTRYTYKPNYYPNYAKTYTYTPRSNYTRSYSYTPRTSYTSRTFTRYTRKPTNSNSYARTYTYTPRTTSIYTPTASNVKTYTYKPRTTSTQYTYKPANTTTSKTTATTYSRYYRRSYT